MIFFNSEWKLGGTATHGQALCRMRLHPLPRFWGWLVQEPSHWTPWERRGGQAGLKVQTTAAGAPVSAVLGLGCERRVACSLSTHGKGDVPGGDTHCRKPRQPSDPSPRSCRSWLLVAKDPQGGLVAELETFLLLIQCKIIAWIHVRKSSPRSSFGDMTEGLLHFCQR